MKETKVKILILNYNGAKILKECLDSVSEIDYSNYSIVLIDNNSIDNSIEFVKSSYSDVEVVQTGENRLYAGGYNYFFNRDSNSCYYMILNNDTIVDKNFIEPLVRQLLTHKKASQTVPKIYYENDPKLIWYAGGIVNLWTGSIYHLGIRQYDGPAYSKTHKTKYATGCCFCMRYEEFKEFGGFDEIFPMYSEDVDLSLWIRAAGKQVWFVPDSKIWHKVSASLGGAFSFGKMVRKARGIFLLIKKHANLVQWLTLIVLLPIQLIIVLLKLIFKVGR